MDKAIKRSFLIRSAALATGLLLVVLSVTEGRAQSNDPNFPTPIVGNEVSGTIQARAIGDPRLTTYYFVFNGNRGDVFINILTTNFKGEIDIYTAKGLNPRTKVTIYADNPERETGRVVYQRQSERLILRLQGRTPNDDPATYQIKFAGTFAPITGAEAENTNEFPDILTEPSSGVKTSATGAILPVEKKDVPAAADEPAEDVAYPDEIVAEEDDIDSPPTVDPPDEFEKKSDQPVAEEVSAREKPGNPRVVVTDPLADVTEKPREVTVDLTEGKKDDEISALVTVERVPADDGGEPAGDETQSAGTDDKTADEPADVRADQKPAEENAPTEEGPNPLARVFLKVELKDGSRIERRMTEVISVNVVNGMLTIVTTDGSTREIPILDVLKMTIEQ